MGHHALRSCLKTMKNWRQEICNYHRLWLTNAEIEGKKLKN
ncbi:transposase (plasmid) [Bacillus tropicus]|nr:transposase [Bacillus tropicus]